MQFIHAVWLGALVRQTEDYIQQLVGIQIMFPIIGSKPSIKLFLVLIQANQQLQIP